MSFLKSLKKITIHIAIVIAVACISVLGIFYYLDYYTLNKQTIEVPELENMTLKEAILKVKEENLNYIITDSVYVKGVRKVIILKQSPLSHQYVKQNRVIYLKVTRSAISKVKIPLVIDLSRRLAVAKLESYGVKVRLAYEPAICKDCVVRQLYNGKDMHEEQEVRKEQTVKLVIGSGAEGAQAILPNLIGLKKEQAIKRLRKAFLSEGISTCINCITKNDSINALVYKQTPPFDSTRKKILAIGETVDFWTAIDTTNNTRVPVSKEDSLDTSINSK